VSIYFARELERELAVVQFTVDFYRRRVNALSKWQKRMREPERTAVCDILANGRTLDPPIPSNRYEVKEQLASQVDGLKVAVRNLQECFDKVEAERDEANARLALSMEAHQITISGTVASLLHTITLTREAAGCRDGDNLPAFIGNMRTMIDAVYAMGYEWRWTKSIDENGEQVGAWVMRDAAEADANNERFRRTDGE
jgi:hypothetical protein